MHKKPTVLTIAAVLSLGTLLVPHPNALGKKKSDPSLTSMSEQQRAVHALNRLTFGPRPGEIERVSAMGVDKWIDQQLHPERISNDALDARLAPLLTLRMNSRQLAQSFPSGPFIKGVVDGRISMPNDPAERAVYQMAIARYENKQERKQAAQLQPAKATAGGDSGSFAPDFAPSSNQGDTDFANSEARRLIGMAPEQRLNEVLKLSTSQQRDLIDETKGEQREKILDGMPPQQKEILEALNNPQQVVNDELFQGKLLRAIYGERQLEEVMTDFWFNHFNVFIGKGADRYMITDYERDVIRPHALGKFEDLLVATAQSPAMLFYLDNWQSVGPNSDVANGIPKRNNGNWKKRAKQTGPVRLSKGKRNGLNENYGRELMELHTLGVNGGYSQKDVTEVAKVLTGWTLKQPAQGGDFQFDERMHEPGEKLVLGHRIKPNGEKEGLRGPAHTRSQSCHRKICLQQAGHSIRVRRSADRFGRSHDGNIFEERWRHSGSLDDDAEIARILDAIRLSRESKNSAGICSVRGARQRIGHHQRDADC